MNWSFENSTCDWSISPPAAVTYFIDFTTDNYSITSENKLMQQEEGAWALDKAQPKEINNFLEVQPFHTQDQSESCITTAVNA